MKKLLKSLLLICFILKVAPLSAQQLERISADDPWQLLNFRPVFVQEKKIKSVTVRYAFKNPGQVIVYKNFQDRLWFDSLGHVVRKLRTTDFGHYGSDSSVINYYYDADEYSGEIYLKRKEEKSKNSELITYIDQTDQGEEQTTMSRSDSLSRFSVIEKKRTEVIVPESYVNNRSIYINDQLTETSENLFDENDRIVSCETTYPHNQKIQVNWEYLGPKLTDMIVLQNGTKDQYKISYGKFSILTKIEHFRNDLPLETMEYFYFDGLLESTLKLVEGETQFSITNYSYEYY